MTEDEGVDACLRTVARALMPDFDPVAYDEQRVLGSLLVEPRSHRWELDGLTVALFSRGAHRQIAAAMIAVRDSGRFFHWKRVRMELNRRKQEGAAAFIGPLFKAIGTTLGLTASISRLHERAARRAA